LSSIDLAISKPIQKPFKGEVAGLSPLSNRHPELWFVVNETHGVLLLRKHRNEFWLLRRIRFSFESVILSCGLV